MVKKRQLYGKSNLLFICNQLYELTSIQSHNYELIHYIRDNRNIIEY